MASENSDDDEATEERTRGKGQQPQPLLHRWKVKELRAEHKAKLKQRDAECKRKTAREWLSQLVAGAPAWRRLPVISSVPCWMAETPSSHRLYERGGLFACAACGGIGAYKPQKLLQECNAGEGHLTDAW